MGRPSSNTKAICLNCGIEFGYRPSMKRKYCSCECYDASRSVLTVDDFWGKVNKCGPVPEHVPHIGQCWPWIGANTGNDGYGTFNVKRKKISAHRHSLGLKIGRDLVKGEMACHYCDNPICVRPDHLFVGVGGDNINDAISKGRRAVGEKHHKSKLTEDQVREIRRLFEEKQKTMKEIAISFGLSIKSIWKIITRKTWRHVH